MKNEALAKAFIIFALFFAWIVGIFIFRYLTQIVSWLGGDGGGGAIITLAIVGFTVAMIACATVLLDGFERHKKP